MILAPAAVNLMNQVVGIFKRWAVVIRLSLTPVVVIKIKTSKKGSDEQAHS
jgi:hypothetical protein